MKASFRMAQHVMDTLAGATMFVTLLFLTLTFSARAYSMPVLLRTVLPMLAPSAVLLVITIRLRYRDRWALVATWVIATFVLLAPWGVLAAALVVQAWLAAAPLLVFAICFSAVGHMLLRNLRRSQTEWDRNQPVHGFEVLPGPAPDGPPRNDTGSTS
jgi:hypothetical protein